MKKPQFKGYILEEILAYLIRTSGYNLITKAPPNDPDLTNSHNGLNLRGRGTNHQIDVLGELSWIPAFTFPLRLITEAKFHTDKTGIDVIRSEVGILADVNQNYFVLKNSEVKPRFRYSTVVFSASGFTEPAVDMAIAHQIQLVDLSEEEYSELKVKINHFTDAVFNNSEDIDTSTFHSVKKYIRSILSNNDEITTPSANIKSQCDTLISFIKSYYQELFIGMSQGGFMLLLKAENPDSFLNYAKANPTHNIKIKWKSIDNGKIWYITPMNDTSYKLSFKLPTKLHKWIFEGTKEVFSEALNQKGIHFSKIYIYYNNSGSEDKNYVFNLRFSKDNLTEVSS